MSADQKRRVFAQSPCVIVYQEGTDLPVPSFLSPLNSVVFVASVIEQEVSLSAFVRRKVCDSTLESGFVPRLPLELFALNKKSRNLILENICCANAMTLLRMPNSMSRAMDAFIGKLMMVEDKTIVRKSILVCFSHFFFFWKTVSAAPAFAPREMASSSLGLNCLMSGYVKLNAKKRFCVVTAKAFTVFNQEEDVLQNRKVLMIKFEDVVSDLETRASDGALILASTNFKAELLPANAGDDLQGWAAAISEGLGRKARCLSLSGFLGKSKKKSGASTAKAKLLQSKRWFVWNGGGELSYYEKVKTKRWLRVVPQCVVVDKGWRRKEGNDIFVWSSS